MLYLMIYCHRNALWFVPCGTYWANVSQ